MTTPTATSVDPIAWTTDLIRLEIELWNRVDTRLRTRHDLPLAAFEALRAIAQAQGPGLRVGELAVALHVTVGGTSKLVDRIERAGLVSRQADPGDRRAAHITLTPAGRRALRAATRGYHAEMTGILDTALSPREQQEMGACVARLLEATGVRDRA